MAPNRVAVILTALVGLAGAVTVPLANLDWSSTAGVLGGLAVVLGAANRWLVGWQAHEARTLPRRPVPTQATTPVPYVSSGVASAHTLLPYGTRTEGEGPTDAQVEGTSGSGADWATLHHATTIGAPGLSIEDDLGRMLPPSLEDRDSDDPAYAAEDVGDGEQVPS